MSAGDEILVFGATGRQGGAVARELLRRGEAVRALVRDPLAEGAQRLADAGAALVTGDMEDAESLDAAMRGVSRVYSVQTFTGPDGVEGEERQGKAVADAAVRAGVGHFVYGSVGGADRGSGVPHFESKGRVEQHLEKLDLPVSILQPAMFISNFTGIGPARADGGLVLSLALEPDTELQMITTEDIGFFAADAFDNPERYLGRRTEIAGDALTGAQMAAVFSRACGETCTFRQQSLEEVRSFSEEAAIMFGWFNREGYRADIPALRKIHPGLTTLEPWVRENWSAPAA
ncbi:NmrA/HSCARG family protein [Actinacidiphila bryophytorum]|uniref:NmrA/HSCARG family protein n=1 Tax=Actinacidiphila bryophytorum TaxID=1436133 RepID=A0A9W4H7L3_9ACTN|nr:NmrA/HSCARG family protein [Actinacidiphila bryophytorum]MBM9438288.1 NmrA/HSCARG family protein [Actinacidiphila bryophytorum]MBN6546261.1 NmrA/HSCARG family protein [Actinacidiphila bryophytorum]CAG7657902.1 NmrA/HSCARG family protein [Actinacidiphila bryophytorum]